MQDLDYDKLANLIVDKLIEKQKQLDREQEEVEHQIAELARLETLVQLYEEQEKYQKAAIVLRKLNNLKARLIKKGVII
jgi:FtsZ-binding cell division protein ZapB